MIVFAIFKNLLTWKDNEMNQMALQNPALDMLLVVSCMIIEISL